MIENSVCAVIITYNCGNEFCESFLTVNGKVDKVIIVDNGSNNKTLDMLNEIKSKYDIELILNNENIGIASALNKGLKYAINNKYNWVLTLDHDSKLTDNMIENMFNAYNKVEKEDRKKIVSIVPNYIEEKLLNKLDKNELQENIEYIENGITSGNLVKVSAVKEIGFFNDDLFIDCVDSDFCCRIIEKGYKIIKVNNAILIHNLGETRLIKFLGRNIQCSNHSYIRRYYMTRNRFYLWEKYKNITPKYISYDKRANRREIIKIILFEQNKLKKLNMIFKGYIDYKRNNYGKIKI